MATRITGVFAPSSDQNIVQDVEQYLRLKGLEGTQLFEHYDDALRVVWPALLISNPEASLLVSINVYLEVAEKRGFEVKPDFLKQAKRDGLL